MSLLPELFPAGGRRLDVKKLGPAPWLLLLLLLAGCGSGPAPATETPAGTPTSTPEIGVTLITRAPPTVPVIRTTPTPLPSATPTPTATPILYRVEEGDTLLGIALENFTNVEAIRTRNPDVVAELLQIGQELELPPPATPIFQGQASTPLPLEVTVARVATYRTPVGSLWVLGEVVNEGAFPAANVRVQIDVAGSEGSSLQVPAWVVPGVVPAGARAPFGVLLADAPLPESPPTVSIVGGEALASLGTYTLDLAVGQVEATIEEEYAALSGVVANRGDAPALQIVVVATFYDAQGAVSGYAQQRLAGPLAPGARLPFTLETTPPGGQVSDYELLVQGVTR